MATESDAADDKCISRLCVTGRERQALWLFKPKLGENRSRNDGEGVFVVGLKGQEEK
jgi:hypothetical protein